MPNKTQVVHVAMEPAQYKELLWHAKRLGFSMSLLCRMCLMEYLAGKRKSGIRP